MSSARNIAKMATTLQPLTVYRNHNIRDLNLVYSLQG